MEQIQKILLVLTAVLIPLWGIALADDCFDTIIENDGKILYIDPNDKFSTFEDRDVLVWIYWNKLKCPGHTKVYTSEEYINFIFEDINKKYWKQESTQSTSSTIIEIILSIIGFVAMWRIFNKAWKPWINSIIPIYNVYELSDIAWLSWLFKKAFISFIIWIILYFFVPIVGMILMWIFVIFIYIVNYNVARNFWRSTFSSLLYVIFNPIAILFLAFWNDKYYITEQKDNFQNEIMKREIENLVVQWINDKGSNVPDTNCYNNQNENVNREYVDPNDINW